ncbi:MAG: hypothetical protein IJK18_03915 [Clostridia bacterium]|nr:hypothetical protein [Clostridia bacterium]
MKKIIFKILKDICIAYMIFSIIIVIVVNVEAQNESKKVSQNQDYEGLPLIETIDEMVSKYKNEENTISSDSYSKLLSNLAFYTTFIPLASLWAAIVYTIVSNVILAIFDKVSTNKLNKQLQKHQ